MAETLAIWLNIRLPGEKLKRVSAGSFPPSCTIANFKEKVAPLLNGKNDFEFIHHGQVLDEDTSTFEHLKIESNTTIHAFQKIDKPPNPRPITKEEINHAVYAFTAISAVGVSFKIVRQEEFSAKVLDAYPDFHTDLGAYAILRDGQLLSEMKKHRFAQKCAEHYPTLIRAAEFIATTIMECSAPAPNREEFAQLDWSMSPSSPEAESPSEGESSGSSQNPVAEGSRINRNQLEAALSLATSAGHLPAAAQPMTAAATLAQATPSTASRSNVVAESVLRDFFTNVLSGARSSGASTAATAETAAAAVANEPQLYTGQLQTMREIGLTDEAINLQALVLCNGDVEAAINFVMLSNS